MKEFSKRARVGSMREYRAMYQRALEDPESFWGDIGWVTGHSYIVYGPLSCGTTVVMYESARSSPKTWMVRPPRE